MTWTNAFILHSVPMHMDYCVVVAFYYCISHLLLIPSTTSFHSAYRISDSTFNLSASVPISVILHIAYHMIVLCVDHSVFAVLSVLFFFAFQLLGSFIHSAYLVVFALLFPSPTLLLTTVLSTIHAITCHHYQLVLLHQ